MNKTISKAKLDAAIEAVRRYYDPDEVNEGDAAKKLLDICNAVKPFCIVIISNLLSSIFSHRGIKADATNDEIYKVLEVLGWSVVEGDSHE